MSNPGFQQSFGVAPIILTGGIAANVTGGMSIADLLGGDSEDLDNAFAQFVPLAGGTIISQQVGTYTFANQAVAANATIANPLTVSIKMIIPVRDGGYSQKLAVMTALQSSLAQHNASGGTYTVATPAFYYDNCLLTELRDISDGSSKQAQIEWQFDFYKPLLTLEDAAAAQSTMTAKVSNSLPLDGDPPAWSGVATTAGAPPGVGSDGTSSTVAPPLGATLPGAGQ